MEERRPDPDILLEEVRASENRKDRGRLKIFFGYAAGVGKTYTMLEDAQIDLELGVDVVVGYVEPHQRPQTLELLEGLPQIPPVEIKCGAISLKEFNIDCALKRRPQLILVDELAHTNAKGSRHLKRYQDVEELLRAGINVYTTVNVQHIESLNDIIESITGIPVRERIPDNVFDSADKVELIDIEPEDLVERFNSGKIYKNEHAQTALSNFFTMKNLIALREIALRRTADRVNLSVEKSKILTNTNEYFTEEHILICLSSSPSNAKVIRSAARIADAFHGTFVALFVETSNFNDISDKARAELRKNLHLAEELGAKIVTVYGDDIAYQISEYAKISGVSKIVIGRGKNRNFFGVAFQNYVDKLAALVPKIDICIVPTKNINHGEKAKKKFKFPSFSLRDTLVMLLFLIIPTAIGFGLQSINFGEANIITVFILCSLFTAVVTKGKVYSLVSSVLAVVLFSFFFTEPKFSFSASRPGSALTFLVMFLSAFITSTFTKRVKDQARQASFKAYRTEVLLETSLKLQSSKNRQEVYQESANQIMKLLNRTVLMYPVTNGTLADPLIIKTGEEKVETYLSTDEYAVAQWAYKNNKQAGATTSTLPGAKCLYMTIRSNNTVFAVVAVAIDDGPNLHSFEKNLLTAMLSECALAIERATVLEKNNNV